MSVSIDHFIPQPLKLAGLLALTSMALSLPLSANAGFLDSLYNAQNSIRSIGQTADTILGSKRAVEDLGEEVGITAQPKPNSATVQGATVTMGQVVTGAVLIGKLQNTSLYSMPDKTSSPVASLSRQDIMIYMGTEQNGYYHVQSDKGEGWVAKPLVAVQ